MDRYFDDMLPVEELEQLTFIPTISEFVEWIQEKWHNLPALSDTVSTCTYAKMCNDIAHKRALLNSLGLQKGDKVAILDNAIPRCRGNVSCCHISWLCCHQSPVTAS